MAIRTRNICLPPAMDAFVEQRVRSGWYTSASDVLQAAMRALAREEAARVSAEWAGIMAKLPQGPLTPAEAAAIVKLSRPAGRTRTRR